MEIPASMKQALEQELASIDKEMGPLLERRDAISRLIATYNPDGLGRDTAKTPANKDLNFIDMAITVLRNAGKPLTIRQIESQIQATFGVPAARSLYQMLYKRAKNNDRFTRDANGSFTLTAVTAAGPQPSI